MKFRKGESNNLILIAIVAIVAVVGLIMFSSSASVTGNAAKGVANEEAQIAMWNAGLQLGIQLNSNPAAGEFFVPANSGGSGGGGQCAAGGVVVTSKSCGGAQAQCCSRPQGSDEETCVVDLYGTYAWSCQEVDILI